MMQFKLSSSGYDQLSQQPYFLWPRDLNACDGLVFPHLENADQSQGAPAFNETIFISMLIPTSPDADGKRGKPCVTPLHPISLGGVQIELDIDPEDKVSRGVLWLDVR